MTEQRHAALGLHPIEGHGPDDGDGHAELLKRRQIARRALIAGVIVIVLLAAGAGRTVLSRIANAKTLEAGAAEHAKVYVKTTLPKTGGANQSIALPGTLQGYMQSPISARATGYLKRWTKDIGATVQKGELLAELETPETDQQLTQAIAAREQAASSLALAQSTVARWESLRKKDVVSQQELDERRSNAAQAKSNLAAADANVARLQQLEGFKRVTAPFSGVITRRNVDTGDLIDAGGGNSRALFLLSQNDPLRIYVNVPQTYAQLVKIGQQVTITQGEMKGQTFRGTVARTAGSIDTGTRTMQVEVSLPNPDNLLLPGAYVQVQLPLQASKALLIPTNTLLFRAEGTRVAVVDGQGRVTLRRVSLGRNYGESLEVMDGLAANDRLVLNPPDSMTDGDQVALAPAATTAEGAAASAGSGKDSVGKEAS
jgi:RND family efflux transporter MFP subunit